MYDQLVLCLPVEKNQQKRIAEKDLSATSVLYKDFSCQISLQWVQEKFSLKVNIKQIYKNYEIWRQRSVWLERYEGISFSQWSSHTHLTWEFELFKTKMDSITIPGLEKKMSVTIPQGIVNILRKLYNLLIVTELQPIS